jgi:hypothetical protein
MPNNVVDVWKTGDHKSPLLTSNAASAAKLAVNHCGGNEIYNTACLKLGQEHCKAGYHGPKQSLARSSEAQPSLSCLTLLLVGLGLLLLLLDLSLGLLGRPLIHPIDIGVFVGLIGQTQISQ